MNYVLNVFTKKPKTLVYKMIAFFPSRFRFTTIAESKFNTSISFYKNLALAVKNLSETLKALIQNI